MGLLTERVKGGGAEQRGGSNPLRLSEHYTNYRGFCHKKQVGTQFYLTII